MILNAKVYVARQAVALMRTALAQQKQDMAQLKALRTQVEQAQSLQSPQLTSEDASSADAKSSELATTAAAAESSEAQQEESPEWIRLFGSALVPLRLTELGLSAQVHQFTLQNADTEHVHSGAPQRHRSVARVRQRSRALLLGECGDR